MMTAAVSFKQVEEAPASSMVQLVNHAIAKHQASMATLALPTTTAHPMSSMTTPKALHFQNDRHCWDEMFSQLLQHQKRYGTTQVPLVYPENQEFSDWVREQQALKCNDMNGDHLDDETDSTPVLSRNQIKKLNAVGFEWVNHLDNNEAIWELRFEELCQYQREHGDCMVPARYRTNPQLGHWVMTQRSHYQLLQKVKPCSITPERVRRLENISFPWRIRLMPEKVWQTRYAQLSEYRETYGDCLVPQRFHPNPQLGFWVNTQRRHYKLMKEGKKSCMTQERIQMLEASGFIWMTGYRIKRHIHQEKKIHGIGERRLRLFDSRRQ
uniref:Helicase-associated domain-containing protein n=1 Tax=Attheya septentrionalis TaxID=420275 RepID=A0A7S2U4X3_9STRA|mmetsp:Transcript_10544/g.19212  ORF Transcript_10544/g.19212 Transcript_10544/m.19212 type:complete len:325 (+) Transcript_10544:303-1277(+)